MLRRRFVQAAGIAGGSVIAAPLVGSSRLFGMPNEDNRLRIAADFAFTTVLVEANGFIYLPQLSTTLDDQTTYFWRQERFDGSQYKIVYHGLFEGQDSQELVDLYNDELIPFAQEVANEPVPPIPDELNICHVPPGNPNNAHELVIPVEDLESHLLHGDSVGNCPPSAEQSGPASKGASSIPVEFEMGVNYPNPMSSMTTIPLALPEAAATRLTIFNLLGQKVETVLDAQMPAGRHEMMWRADHVPSGTYILVMEADSFRATRRIVVAK